MKHILTLLACILFVTTSLFAQKVHQPSIQVNYAPKETPVQISDVKIDVKVVGTLVTTVVDMMVYNPNDRILEGTLDFPLGEGQSISRFALDINGKLREAVPVDKAKGQAVFEDNIRHKIDPGLLEKTQGNNFTTRLYPLPPKGYRHVLLAYEQELQSQDGAYVVHVPVEYDAILKTFSLKVTSFNLHCEPNIRKSSLVNFSFNESGSAYVALFSAKNYLAKGELVFSVPEAQQQVMVEKGVVTNDTYFVANVKPPVLDKAAEQPKIITLFWDVSSSMESRDSSKEFQLLNAYFNQINTVKVHLIRFNCLLGSEQTFKITNGNWSKLKEALMHSNYDGATQLGSLNFKDGLNGSQQILLFSDGMSNFGNETPTYGTIPVNTINSQLSADISKLTFIANKTGGKFINLVNQLPEPSAKQLLSNEYQFISATYNPNQMSALTPSSPQSIVNHSFSIAGKLLVNHATIQLNFGVGNNILYSKTIELSKNGGASFESLDQSGSVERMWAEKTIRELDLCYDVNKSRIEELGKMYNIVTRNTSLIVLDQVSDYVKYKITPPAELMDEYTKMISDIQANEEDEKKDKLITDAEQLNNSAQAFMTRKDWWNKLFPEPKKPQETEIHVPEPPGVNTPTPPVTNTEADQVAPIQVTPESDISGLVLTEERDTSGIFITIQGRVIEATGPLEGVVVACNNHPSIGTITDENGNFQLRVPSNTKSLVFEYTGMKTKSIPINHQSSIHVVMEDNDITLSEVVVTGSGVERVARTTTSISPIAAFDIPSPPLESATQDRVMEDQAVEDRVEEDDLVLSKGTDYNPSEIVLSDWNPDMPYLSILTPKADADLYATYLTIKAGYKESPSFYLDVANLMIKRGLKDEALIVLSNLAELQVQDYQIMRVLAYRLKQLNYNDYALAEFEKVAKLRPEEPQSLRDLSSIYAQKKDYQKAIDLLYEIVKKEWDDRFPDIQVTAAEEMNAIITQAQNAGIPVNLTQIDPRFISPMPVDIRIVLNWDTDNSDMDLWVTDPSGEKCYYKHALTAQGGMISDDFTEGYGPEEFLIKKAKVGDYKIQANYYGTDEQSLLGPTTIYLDIYTHYGTPQQVKKTITMRLTDKKEVVDVGQITF